MIRRLPRYVPAAFAVAIALASGWSDAEPTRPNILFCIADDWGWPNAGVYGDPVVQTPAFDRIANEGVLFENAFVTSPSCTPCRNSILTGQYHWRLEHGGNLWSTLHPRFPVYPDLLADAGYAVGHWRKAWGPGNWKFLGRQSDPAGPTFPNFGEFLKRRTKDQPFCFWLGASDPHRPYRWKSGSASGIDVDQIELPADLPDHETIREDVADYYFEVQRFDRDVAAAIKLLEETGELENTIVVMTGDHGMPFPRHKCNLYDSGTHVCLAVRWGQNIEANRRVTDFVSLADLAPTFLDVAGVETPQAMTGRSLMGIFRSQESGQIEPSRDHVLTGRERHTVAQLPPSTGGYPMRAIRTADFLYIRNLIPERWPSGAPDAYRDIDGSPSKTFLLNHRDDPLVKPFFELAMGKRPAEELYDLREDPHQLNNVADEPAHRDTLQELSTRLTNELRQSGDPRVTGGGERFDEYPYRPGDNPRTKTRKKKPAAPKK